MAQPWGSTGHEAWARRRPSSRPARVLRQAAPGPQTLGVRWVYLPAQGLPPLGPSPLPTMSLGAQAFLGALPLCW